MPKPVASALATALLRSIRRLERDWTWSYCVVELYLFAEVSVAVRTCCEDLRCKATRAAAETCDAGASHNGSIAGAADAVPWARRLRQARAAAALIPGDAAFDQCRGRIVCRGSRLRVPFCWAPSTWRRESS